MRNDKFTGKHCSRGYCCSIISSESHVRYLYLSKMHGLPDSHFSTRCCRPSMSFSQLYHLASLHASILPVLSARKNLSRVTSLILIIYFCLQSSRVICCCLGIFTSHNGNFPNLSPDRSLVYQVSSSTQLSFVSFLYCSNNDIIFIALA